jgi:hypothetical protein
MTDETRLSEYKPSPTRQTRPGELLFEFVRVSDSAPMSADRGAFPTRALAVRWAEDRAQ